MGGRRPVPHGPPHFARLKGQGAGEEMPPVGQEYRRPEFAPAEGKCLPWEEIVVLPGELLGRRGGECAEDVRRESDLPVLHPDTPYPPPIAAIRNSRGGARVEFARMQTRARIRARRRRTRENQGKASCARGRATQAGVGAGLSVAGDEERARRENPPYSAGCSRRVRPGDEGRGSTGRARDDQAEPNITKRTWRDLAPNVRERHGLWGRLRNHHRPSSNRLQQALP